MKILIAEDEKEIRKFIRNNLERESYLISEASDGEEAMDMIKKNDFDLLILDNMMPKKTGLEIINELRNHGNDVPILMLSVKSEATTKADVLNAGADDYLSKPFSLDELLARIKALLRRPKSIENESYRLDNLELDASSHAAYRDGLEIQLAHKEYLLLKYLLENKGTVLPRNMIMDRVWNMTADPFSNTIEAHINSLKKKIDIKGQKELISIIPGKGFGVGLD